MFRYEKCLHQAVHCANRDLSIFILIMIETTLRRLERVFSARARFYCSRQLGIQIAIKDARATSEIEETGNETREKHFFLFRKLTR